MRGDELRRHLLWQAKTVFLDAGFEGTSMDAVARAAGTTKRTLYAHFGSKEGLFLEVVELVRSLLDAKIGAPDGLAARPPDALSLFCSRVRASFLWGPTIRTCRLGIGEAQRFSAGAAGFHDALFGTATTRIATYVAAHWRLPGETCRGVAGDLLALALEPSFTRALFGVEAVPEDWSGDAIGNPVVGAATVEQVIASRAGRSAQALLSHAVEYAER